MESSEVTNVLENDRQLQRDQESGMIQGHTSFHRCWGSSSKVVQIHRPRKSKLLPEMEAKERKMRLRSFLCFGVKAWNCPPSQVCNLPKLAFKKSIRIALFAAVEGKKVYIEAPNFT